MTVSVVQIVMRVVVIGVSVVAVVMSAHAGDVVVVSVGIRLVWISLLSWGVWQASKV